MLNSQLWSYNSAKHNSKYYFGAMLPQLYSQPSAMLHLISCMIFWPDCIATGGLFHRLMRKDCIIGPGRRSGSYVGCQVLISTDKYKSQYPLRCCSQLYEVAGFKICGRHTYMLHQARPIWAWSRNSLSQATLMPEKTH